MRALRNGFAEKITTRSELNHEQYLLVNISSGTSAKIRNLNRENQLQPLIKAILLVGYGEEASLSLSQTEVSIAYCC